MLSRQTYTVIAGPDSCRPRVQCRLPNTVLMACIEKSLGDRDITAVWETPAELKGLVLHGPHIPLFAAAQCAWFSKNNEPNEHALQAIADEMVSTWQRVCFLRDHAAEVARLYRALAVRALASNPTDAYLDDTGLGKIRRRLHRKAHTGCLVPKEFLPATARVRQQNRCYHERIDLALRMAARIFERRNWPQLNADAAQAIMTHINRGHPDDQLWVCACVRPACQSGKQ